MVELFWLLQSSLKRRWTRVLLMAGISGVLNASILMVLNAGSFAATRQTLSIRYLLLFMICAAGFYTAKRYAITEGSRAAEEVLRDLLVRIANKVRRSELPVVERIMEDGTYHSIAHDTTVISQATLFLINSAQQSIMLVVALLYIAFISPVVFVIALVGVGLGVLLYHLHTHLLLREIGAQKQAETGMVRALEHVFNGFKEVRLNARRSIRIREWLNSIGDDLYQTRVRTNTHYCTELMFADVFFYLLLAAVVFIVPEYCRSSVPQTLMSVAAILFIIGPLQSIVSSGPVFMRASVAIENFAKLERELDAALKNFAGTADVEPERPSFANITLSNVVYRYPRRADDSGDPNDNFQVGPFSLDIQRGETLFLVGGNGCGKTTLLKVLTGLYQPTEGALLVDGQEVTPHTLSEYRNRFSAIFSDFHLFDRLYGYEDADPARVEKLLQRMAIAEKTAFHDGQFSTLKLSTGQRKRLAMVTALLEERDILVFDEWAADQDPLFRAYFYETLLAAFKDQGKTVIAVTHDERYWDLADRIVRLDYGKLADPSPRWLEEGRQ